MPPQLNVRTEMARVLNARDRLKQEYEGDDDVSFPYESDLADLTVPMALWPPTCDEDWCGEHQPATVADTVPETFSYTTKWPFQKLFDLISTRAGNSIESSGTHSWEHLFANAERHPKGHDQPIEYRQFGEKMYLEMLLAMAELGVKAPSRWVIPKHVKSEFVKAGGEFFEGEYRSPTVAEPPAPGA